MNQREKLLALIAGSLIGVFALAYIGLRVTRAMSSYDARLTAARANLDNTELEIAAGLMASEELQEIASKALPWQREVARTAYQEWLVNLVTDAGLASPSVDARSVTQNKDVFEIHSFEVSGTGDLRQISSLLARLHAAPVAHRVQRLSFRPVRDKKDITLGLTLEVLSMPTAPTRTSLPKPEVPKQSAAQQVVLQRNLFAPENQQPELNVQPSYVAYVGQPFNLQPAGSDPDKLDKVQFEADVSALPNARARQGTVEWTPREEGEYSVTIAALDDGIPSRRVERQVKIRVQQPPAPAPSEPKKVDLTAAKFAVVTGVTSIRGEPEAWLSLRTEGRTLKLGVGDTFKLGDVEASITAIDPQAVEIAAAGQRVKVRLGQSLAESGLK